MMGPNTPGARARRRTPQLDRHKSAIVSGARAFGARGTLAKQYGVSVSTLYASVKALEKSSQVG